jgi:hypothetical protein
MHEKFTRKILQTTINSAKVVIDGENPLKIDNAPIIVNGKITNEKAVKIVEKTFGKGALYIVRSVDTKENTYEISVVDFIKNATLVTPKLPKTK